MNSRNANRGNAAEHVARNEVDVAAARLMNQLGFTHGTHTTMDLLSDLAVRYVGKMCEKVRFISEHAGRTVVAVTDVEFAYDKMSVDLGEVNEYMRQNRPISPRLIPEFPAKQPKKLTKVAQIAPSTEQPDYLPVWAPPIYVPDQTTVASSSTETLRPQREPFPDFSSFSALSLGLGRYKPKAIAVQSRPDSRSSQSRSVSQAESRSSSQASASILPQYKKRKRPRESPLPPPSSQPSTSSLLIPVQPMIITGASLAQNHRPAMIAIHTGTAAAPPSRLIIPPPPPIPSSSTLDHESLNKAYTRDLSPRRVAQLAVLRSSFTFHSELDTELQKAFDFIRETIHEPLPSPAPITPPMIEHSYRIIKQEPSTNELPYGALAPLKIKISRASLSGEPSPAGAAQTAESATTIGSPKAKRHKHKKKKHKKEKERHEDTPGSSQDPPLPPDSPRPAIRLKIRFGTS